jgi:hypothetical protein
MRLTVAMEQLSAVPWAEQLVPRLTQKMNHDIPTGTGKQAMKAVRPDPGILVPTSAHPARQKRGVADVQYGHCIQHLKP